MLYLLDDPSLDRSAFELQLVDDSELGEIVAESVSRLQAMRAMKPADWPRISPPEKSMLPVRLPTSANTTRLDWRLCLALAATLLLAPWVNWSALRVPLEKAPQIAMVWSDLRAEEASHMQRQPPFTEDAEVDLGSTRDAFEESELPDWMVLVASVGIDAIHHPSAPLDSIDSIRGFP